MLVRLRREYGQLVTSGGELLLLLIAAKTEDAVGWLICVALMVPIAFFAWRSALTRYRAIADTPTSRIASAAQGYVELTGSGEPLAGLPLLSKLTGLPVLWYRWRVEEKRGKDWHTIDSGESDDSFILDDGTGTCVVDPASAEILVQEHRTWNEGSRRYSEWNFTQGQQLYAIGEFRTHNAALEFDAEADTRALLDEWKRDQPTLLKRFDLDRNGEISMQEWGLARSAARREVEQRHVAARNEADLNTMSAPQGGQMFLLSDLEPERLAKRYRLWALFHLAVFFGGLAALPWLWALAHH